MLSQEENQLITRVGPGTPMGNVFREYWLPAMLSSELPAPDSDPVRVLMLGEQLIAFRESNAKIGLLATRAGDDLKKELAESLLERLLPRDRGLKFLAN